MTSLVVSFPTPTPEDKKPSLSDCILDDVELAQGKWIPILSFFRKRRLRWFYVIDVNANRPTELDDVKYKDINESTIHLPPTTETLTELKKTFQAHAEKLHFSEPVIRYCHNGGVVIYSVKPLR